MRHLAAERLGKRGNAYGLAALATLCEHPDVRVYVRITAAEILASQGDPRGTVTLASEIIECLIAVCTRTREASYVRAAALQLLGTAGEASPRVLEAVTALCEAKDDEVRRSALQVLGKLGAAGEEVLDTLYENLETGHGGEGDWQGLAVSAAVLRTSEVEAWAQEMLSEPTSDG